MDMFIICWWEKKMGFGWIFRSSIFFWHSSQNRQKIMFWLNDQTSRVSNPKVHMTSIITAQLGLCREEFSSSLSRWRAKGEGPWMIPCQWFYTESILQNQPHRGHPSGIKRGQDHVPQHGPRRHLCACNVLRLDPENWVRQKSCRARGAKRALIFLAVKKTAKMTQPQPMEITLPDLLLNHKLHFIIGQFNSFFRYWLVWH